MVLTSNRYMSDEDEELDEAGNYLDIIHSASYSYLRKRFKVRRLICRVCKLKFRTRQETQAHIKGNIEESRQKHNDEKDAAKPYLAVGHANAFTLLNGRAYQTT
jgi:hypothetical protein